MSSLRKAMIHGKKVAASCAKPRHAEIAIGDGYVLSADSHCWTLMKRTGIRKNRKSGHPETQWRPEGYFPTIEGALKHLTDLELRLCGAQSFDELLQHAKTTRKLLRDALAPLKLERD
jgi:hypothetical protein